MAISLETADKYVDYVRAKVKEDPGRRAALRRSLGRPVEHTAVHRAHSVVAPWLPADRTPRAVESAYYSVAALIAAQPCDRDEQADAASGEQAAAETASLPQDEPGDAKTTGTKTVRPSTSLGATLGQAVRDKKLTEDTVESRLHLLCRQDVAGLHRMLPGLVRRLTANDLAPDWGRLLVDLSRWEYERDRVTKRWLQDFYRAIHQAEPTDDDAESEDQ